MPQRPDELAASMLYQYEGNPELTDYLKTGGANLDPVKRAWCAAFVNASLEQAGYKGTGINAARSFLNWKGGDDVLSPREGDIAVFRRRDDDPDASDATGHVGFYQGNDEFGNIKVLGGNQGDQVNVTPLAENRVLGFRRPHQDLPETLATAVSPEVKAAIPDLSAQRSMQTVLNAPVDSMGAVQTPGLADLFKVPGWENPVQAHPVRETEATPSRRTRRL